MQRCAVDDDTPSLNVCEEEKPESIVGPAHISQSGAVNATSVDDSTKATTITTVNHKENMNSNNANVEAKVYDLTDRLPCNWTTGAGPRIGCVRDYPRGLQSRALEQVNLSPRVPSGPMCNYGPIPSPRPSPKVKVSPRLAYMGLPSPRTPIAAAS